MAKIHQPATQAELFSLLFSRLELARLMFVEALATGMDVSAAESVWNKLSPFIGNGAGFGREGKVLVTVDFCAGDVRAAYDMAAEVIDEGNALDAQEKPDNAAALLAEKKTSVGKRTGVAPVEGSSFDKRFKMPPRSEPFGIPSCAKMVFQQKRRATI
jgi:hypothetical protein